MRLFGLCWVRKHKLEGTYVGNTPKNFNHHSKYILRIIT